MTFKEQRKHPLEDGSLSQASLAQERRPQANFQGLSILPSSLGPALEQGWGGGLGGWVGGWIRGEPLHGGTWEAEARTELPLHRWEDGERRLQSLKELRAGQRAGHPLCLLAKGFPAPLVSPSASTRPSHCPPAIVPGFLASKEWVRARAGGLELEVQGPKQSHPTS